MLFAEKNFPLDTSIKITVFLLFCAATFLQPVAIAETAKNENSGVQTAGKEVDGAKIYRENCSICHGDAGDGNTRAKNGLRPPPRNFTTIESALELTRDRMIKSVADGRPGTGMMPHKDRLSNAEIDAVVDYIRRNFMYIPGEGDKLVKNVEGEKVYSKHCAVCHGDKGTSAVWAQSGLKPPPRNFTTAQARQELTRDRMINSVTHGRPGTAMQPHGNKLSAKDIEAVVDYINEAFMQGPVVDAGDAMPHAMPPSRVQPRGSVTGHPQIPGFPAVSQPATTSARTNPHQGTHGQGVPAMHAQIADVPNVDMAAPMPKGLQGSSSSGREFYMNNCFACHGESGEGNGPRAHFNTPRPRNFTSDASRRMLNRERLFFGISNGKIGTVMPAWNKVLSEQQIADVAEFVFQHFIISANAQNSAENNKKKPQPQP